MTVGQITNEAVTTTEEEPVIEAAETMDEEGVGVLVAEEDGDIDGVLTDREIALAAAEHDGDLREVAVEDVMTEDVRTLRADDESLEAARTMAETGVRRMPVVDEAGSLVGVVRLDDIVSLTGEQLGDAATVIEKQSPRFEA